MIIIFRIDKLGVFGGGMQYTEMKMNRNFNAFTDFESPELEVPMFCLVTGCVSARRDGRYIFDIHGLRRPVTSASSHPLNQVKLTLC